MATVTVYDLDNYPDNSKTITVQVSSVVTSGGEGDEIWVLSGSTSAYSDITNRTAVQDVYVRNIKAGWAKSSGLAGSGGKFTIASGSRTLGVAMDNSSTYYITLSSGTNLTGDNIASDMEAKIRAIPTISGTWDTSDAGYALSFTNAIVEFVNNKFYVVAGSMGQYYSGSTRTSVTVTASGSDTAYANLGFNLGLSSLNMADIAIKESLLTSSYTAGAATISIGAGTGVAVGDALYVTNGITHDYFTALSGTTDTNIVVATSGTNGFNGIVNSYDVSVSKVQLLSYTDPDAGPTPYYTDVDAITRFAIRTITNQIDFSA